MLRNAAQAGATRIEISAYIDSAESIVMNISNNGTPISRESREEIFVPFFTTKPTSEAAGTGLYLCREMILNHKGSIDVESRQGEYTEFRITIPNSQNITADE